MAVPTLPRLNDRYSILARLGQGRLAVVYRARDERLQRAVLVHFLREELFEQLPLRQRFLDEAQRAAQRSHQGLLDVYDSGEVSGRPYMVTEDLTGRPLAEVVPLPLGDAIGVLRMITSAVALAQSQGAPHPPISSQNVWVAEGGRAILLENWLLAPAVAALDNAHYRSPERARGAPPSPATSVYALGILSWETIVGQRPFVGPTPVAIADLQAREALPLLADRLPWLFAPGLDRVVGGAAAADPQQRYPTPTDYGRALDLYIDQVTAQTGRLAETPASPQTYPPARGAGPFRVFRRGQSAPKPPPAPPPMQVATVEAPATAPVTRSPSRWSKWQQRLQRAIVKRSIQITAIIALIYAMLVGVDYAVSRARQLDPGGWIASRLPQMPRMPDWSVPNLPAFDGWASVRDLFEGSTQLVVTQPVNLRSEPGLGDNIVRSLDAGAVLQRVGEVVEDERFTWIRVIVVEDGTEGWVADQADKLRRD